MMESAETAARSFTFRALADGPEKGPLLILLHGLPCNCWEWHHQITPMAELGFRVIAPDLRGFCSGARQIGVETYHLQEYVDDIFAIADVLGGSGVSFHLMETSIGSTMAWRIAAFNPDRVLTPEDVNLIWTVS
jgi:pimeloyl-ACP methyl ester carboxylesterase